MAQLLDDHDQALAASPLDVGAQGLVTTVCHDLGWISCQLRGFHI